MEIISLLAAIVVIIGALNWGAVGAFNVDLVKMITPGYPMIESGIKIAVGIAAIYYSYVLYMWMSKKDEQKSA